MTTTTHRHGKQREALALLLDAADDRWQHGIGASGYDPDGPPFWLADAVLDAGWKQVPLHYEQRVARTLDIIQDHRRLQNVRSCSGCDWRPARPGYASDPEDTIRRHAEFNRHLSELIVGAVS